MSFIRRGRGRQRGREKDVEEEQGRRRTVVQDAVRELYEHNYRAKDFLTIERGNRGTEQRAMEQKVPSKALPSDLRGSMSPCPCSGLG